MKNMSKKGIETEVLAWWIIGAFVAILIAISAIILTGKGDAAIAFIKDMFRFGG